MIDKTTPWSADYTTLIRIMLIATIVLWTATIFNLRAENHVEVDQDAFVLSITQISVEERDRSGIPASITAAQAILESNWGRAPIAVTGNNYFGIKCKSYWTGNTVLQQDDDYDAKGVLLESCFRAYDDIATSFRDHSDFLVSSERYAKLFELDITNYRAWAKGLRRCGYATDPHYAKKLIGIIERLELYTLDWPVPQTQMLAPNTKMRRVRSQQHTWTEIPHTYVPTGRGAAISARVKPN